MWSSLNINAVSENNDDDENNRSEDDPLAAPLPGICCRRIEKMLILRQEVTMKNLVTHSQVVYILRCYGYIRQFLK